MLALAINQVYVCILCAALFRIPATSCDRCTIALPHRTVDVQLPYKVVLLDGKVATLPRYGPWPAGVLTYVDVHVIYPISF